MKTGVGLVNLSFIHGLIGFHRALCDFMAWLKVRV